MDHITQLKKIRAEAIARLRNSPDFRLAGKLGQLIVELGDTVEDVKIFDDPSLAAPVTPFAPKPADEKPRTFENAFTKPAFDSPSVEIAEDDQEAEDIIDELVADLEGDAAELDALMKESKDKSTLGSISSYFSTDKAEKSLTNGAAH